MLLTCAHATDIDGAVASNGNLKGNVSAEVDSADVKVNGTFDDLRHDIDNLSPGEVYNIDRDYYYCKSGYRLPELGIIIQTDNITINGNGHVMDGKNQSPFFTVDGNNVKIFNVTFINAHYDFGVTNIGTFKFQSGRSPIHWIGDGGVISDCMFCGNSARVMGGAITWAGSNGVINNSLFVNDTAGIIGGAIYMAGSNNTVSQCMFLNSVSMMGGEAIYLDRNNKGCNISAVFDCERLFTDGSITGIDTNYLNYIYESSFAATTINLVPLIYSAIISQDSCVRLDDEITYYAQYIGSEFLLTLSRCPRGSDVVYQRCYHLYDVGTLGDVFRVLVREDYRSEFTFTKLWVVSDVDDYNEARTMTKDSAFASGYILRFTIDTEGLKKDSMTVYYHLNVDFRDSITVDCKKTWNPSKMGFDVVNINGHGSTIKTSSGDRDEHKWATINGGCIFCASDLTIQGFNTAVENLGGIGIFNNVHFHKNHMDYWIERDWGAAILNTGMTICTNCSFTNNKCGNGGAIFTQGSLALNNCTFNGNEAYSNGDNVLNADKGEAYVDGVKIVGSEGCVKYVKSISTVWATIIGVVGMTASALLGVIVGLSTCNPLIGFAAGAGVGALIGLQCSAIIVSNNYNYNLNRLAVCITLIAGCALVGGLGGVIGSSIAASTAAQAADVVVAEETASISSSSSLESVESLSEIGSEWEEFINVWFDDFEFESSSIIAEAPSGSESIVSSLHYVEALIVD